MHRLPLRLLIAICTFALGIAIVALWAQHYLDSEKDFASFVSKESEPGVPTDRGISAPWEKIDMEGKVTFHVPPGLRRINRGATPPNRDLRNDSMQFFAMYANQGVGATCTVQNRERAEEKAGLSEITIAGREATIEYIDQVTFESYQTEPILKGLTICVSDVGDGIDGESQAHKRSGSMSC
jgi:hypothetical protein